MMKPFLQNSVLNSTLENWKLILDDNDLPSLGLFAYVTDSGVAQLITHLSDYIGDSRTCRWVIGFDYGRSQPTAIRKLAEMGQSEIRIYDGEYILQSKEFAPRKNFHLKTVLTHQENGYPNMQIVGSGNLSASGLLSGIEAGCVIDYSSIDSNNGKTLISDLEDIWDKAIPFENIINKYEKLYTRGIVPKPHAPTITKTVDSTQLFWIEIGYVTKNRGKNKPGNQFDLPRGSHVHLGFKENLNPQRNSILGELRIRTPSGIVVNKNLRFGNNSMEKLTLPIPEEYQYHCYDGKILTFKVEGDIVELEAYERDDFLRIYGNHISSSTTMQSGRAYGTILMNII